MPTAHLEGEWLGERVLSKGPAESVRVTFSSEKVTVQSVSHGDHVGSYFVNKPVTHDANELVTVDFEEVGRSLGIMVLTDDKLCWAASAPGQDVPSSFEPAKKTQIFTLRRKPAAVGAGACAPGAQVPVTPENEETRVFGHFNDNSLGEDRSRSNSLNMQPMGVVEPGEAIPFVSSPTSNLETKAPASLKAGFLNKQGHIVKNWKRRYVVLTKKHLVYYETEEAFRCNDHPKGFIRLAQSVFDAHGSSTDKNRFMVRETREAGQTYLFEASSAYDASEWVQAGVEAVLMAWKTKGHEKPPSMRLSVDDQSDGLTRRCRQCHEFYTSQTLVDDLPCQYHPGTFRLPGQKVSIENVFDGWTCCRSMNKDANGCRRGLHVEDKGASDALRQFPQASLEEQEKLRAQIALPKHTRAGTGGAGGAGGAGGSDMGVAEQAPVTVNRDADGNIVHTVQKTDTLPGLALRYGVTVAALKKANRISGSTLFAKTLVIPIAAAVSDAERAGAAHAL